jgi:hypothetical protein
VQLHYFSEKLASEGKPSIFPLNDREQFHDYFSEKFREAFDKPNSKHNSNLGAFSDFVHEDETSEGFEIKPILVKVRYIT